MSEMITMQAIMPLATDPRYPNINGKIYGMTSYAEAVKVFNEIPDGYRCITHIDSHHLEVANGQDLAKYQTIDPMCILGRDAIIDTENLVVRFTIDSGKYEIYKRLIEETEVYAGLRMIAKAHGHDHISIRKIICIDLVDAANYERIYDDPENPEAFSTVPVNDNWREELLEKWDQEGRSETIYNALLKYNNGGEVRV